MTTAQTANYTDLVKSMMGALVLSMPKDEADKERTFRVASLADKTGSLKNGEKVAYVILKAEDDETVVMNLHPEHAKRLFTKGEDAFLKMVKKADGAEAEAPAVDEQKELQAELTQEQMTAAPPVKSAKKAKAEKPAKKEKVKKEEVAAEPKKPSKKDLAAPIYHKLIGEGKARKDVLEAWKEIGIEGAGANTYYQNFKSGAWK